MPKISELASEATPTTSAVVPIVQSSSTFKTTLLSLFDTLKAYTLGAIGAVYRAVTDKLRESISVKDFGAVGDGVTDDTAAIQAAIAHIELVSQRGGRIFFPRGDYKITSTLTILGSQVTLYGETANTEYGSVADKATSRIVWGNTVDDETIYMLSVGDTSGSFVNTRRVSLRNIGFDGQGYVSAVKSVWAPEMIIEGVSFNQVHRAHYCESSGGLGRNYSNTWRDCYFHNFKKFAIRIDDDGHRTNILQCHFTSTGGDYIPPSIIQIGDTNYSSMVNIIGCNFEPFGDASTGAGIYWIDAKSVRNLNVIGNYFEIPAGSTISACIRLGQTNQMYGATIHGNRFLIASDAPDYAAGKSPIEIVRCYGASIAGNFFDTWNGVAVNITGSSGNMRDLWYHGNYGDSITAPFTAGFESRVYAWDFTQSTDIRSKFRLGHTASTTTVVQALTSGDNMQVLNSQGAGAEIVDGSASAATSQAAWRPLADNLQRSGTSVRRWSEVFAGTGTINTSDEREKTPPEAIPQEWLDAWGEVQFIRYKWRDSVERKGGNARWHVGLIAQRVKEVFESHGIDPFSIGLLCYDEWEEEMDDNGVIIQEAGDRYGIRYDQALALECAYLRSKL